MFSPLLKIVLQALLGVIKIRGPEGGGGGRTWETLFRRIESPRNLPGQLLIQALASSPLSGGRWCNFIFCVLRVQKLIFFFRTPGYRSPWWKRKWFSQIQECTVSGFYLWAHCELEMSHSGMETLELLKFRDDRKPKGDNVRLLAKIQRWLQWLIRNNVTPTVFMTITYGKFVLLNRHILLNTQEHAIWIVIFPLDICIRRMHFLLTIDVEEAVVP